MFYSQQDLWIMFFCAAGIGGGLVHIAWRIGTHIQMIRAHRAKYAQRLRRWDE